jgi:ankyrin repeat protein
MVTGALDRIKGGRTDVVFDYLSEGHPANAKDENGIRLVQWCAYYGDVSAIRLLLKNGESLPSLGDNLGLNGAAFHGHWRLCEFLVESGADVNAASPDTGETPLHSALCTANRTAHDLVLRVLLANRADPNRATKPSVEDGRLHARLQNEGVDTPPPCGGLRYGGNDRAST